MRNSSVSGDARINLLSGQSDCAQLWYEMKHHESPESCNVLIIHDFNHIHKGIVCIWIENPQIQLEYLISLVLQVNEQMFTAATIPDFASIDFNLMFYV